MIDIEFDRTTSDSGQPLCWYRWICTRPDCGGAGSWLHDEAKVRRMGDAHAIWCAHVDEEAQL